MNNEPDSAEPTGMYYISGLCHGPLKLSSRWLSKIVTTSPPQYIPHTEHQLVYELSADIPVLATLLLSNTLVTQYQRFWRSSAGPNINITLSFRPLDWNHSDEVSVSLYQRVARCGSGVETRVRNESLKHDPRPFVTTQSSDENRPQTGAVFDLAVVNLSSQLYAKVVVIAKSDTVYCHGRWRLKSSATADLPPSLSFLRQGRCHGEFRLQTEA